MFIIVASFSCALAVLIGTIAWLGTKKKRAHIVFDIEKAQQDLAVERWQEAYARLKQIKPIPKSYQVQIITLMLQALAGMDQWDQLLSLCQWADGQKIESEKITLFYAKALRQCGLPTQAYTLFQKLSGPRTLDEVECLIEMGESKKAVAILELVPCSDPVARETLYGWIAFTEHRYNDTIAYLTPHFTNTPAKSAFFWRVGSQLAIAHFHLNDYKKAAHHFSLLRQEWPYRSFGVLGEGACYEAQGDFLKAMHLYRWLYPQHTKDPRVCRQIGLCLFQQQHYQEAATTLKCAITQGEQSAHTLNLYGLCCEKIEEWQKAEQTYKAIIERYPQHSDGYIALAFLFGTGQTTSTTNHMGIRCATKALELAPSHETWELMSACHARVGNYEQAYQIQLRLSDHPQDSSSFSRRKLAMKTLQDQRPLSAAMLARSNP